MKSGKAPGAEFVSAEMLKAEGEVTMGALTEVFEGIWETEETTGDWKMELIHRYSDIQRKSDELARNAEKIGLQININKTKMLCINENIEMVKLDLDRSLEEQGPFDLIMHKLTDQIGKGKQRKQHCQVTCAAILCK
ncbi:hypothetical protein LSAT2_011866 [Lamellibrachia satsuma]|nr:hypothetical protein LSAT2_011866 [Lamellibrachia satsuma]